MKYRAIMKFEYKGQWRLPGTPCDDMPDKELKKHIKQGEVSKLPQIKEVAKDDSDGR